MLLFFTVSLSEIVVIKFMQHRNQHKHMPTLLETFWSRPSARRERTDVCTLEMNPVIVSDTACEYNISESKLEELPNNCTATVSRDGLVYLTWDKVANSFGYIAFATRQGHRRHVVSTIIPASASCHTLSVANIGGSGSYVFQVAPVYGSQHPFTYGALSASSEMLYVPESQSVVSV